MTPTDPTDARSTAGAAEETALPPVVARLWGRGTPPRRGPKPALSIEQVVRAAVDLADAEGLPAVSMARVAESLGYSSMALYRYVESKDELLALMADAAADVLEMPAHDEADWRAGLAAWTRAQIQGVLARPWYLDLPLTTAQVGPHRLRWIDRAFAILAPLDLTVDEKLQIVGLLAQHVLGEGRVQVETRRAAAEAVRAAQGLPSDTPEADLDEGAIAAANPYADYELVLTRLADPQTYPALTGALAAWTPSTPRPDDWESDIGFGLDILLDGIESFVAKRSAARRSAGDG
ncbi:TetR/AcrR family transcriptional regulator [Cellulosimicrobium protaetiae]|uniref:TetR/AcrR family transcriptional regulator n=1 Tax=Cellulosimicrobium protaetiae TaxID=2587808 RepID=A0A6M5UFD0_9MICO|nr:TetR/AcrR family transcriptional regulator [Cellulosimicrobium protaetiae]QJW35339.1 TetR/AcrR family transcriptional regulator [Cellulosimicrobium protaetiae]